MVKRGCQFSLDAMSFGPRWTLTIKEEAVLLCKLLAQLPGIRIHSIASPDEKRGRLRIDTDSADDQVDAQLILINETITQCQKQSISDMGPREADVLRGEGETLEGLIVE